MINYLKSIDTSLFLLLNGLHNSFFDPIMALASEKYFWIPFYAVILVIIIRKHGVKSLILIIPALVLLITLSDQISVNLFKNIFERYRPCYNTSIQNLVHLVGSCGGQFGFISSHAANSFALATFLVLLMRNKALTWVMIIWACWLSYSRIYVGVHYPADVAGGMGLGFVVGLLVWRALRQINKKFNYIATI